MQLLIKSKVFKYIFFFLTLLLHRLPLCFFFITLQHKCKEVQISGWISTCY